MYKWLLLCWGVIAGASYAQTIDLVATTLWTGVRDVAVREDYAFCAFPNGLLVLDVSDPASPVVASQMDLPGESHEIALAGNYAYIASREAGVHILSVENPTIPVLVATADTPGDALSVSVWGHRLCVAEGNAGLTVLDVLNPAQPELIGRLQTADAITKVVLSERWVYLGISGQGLAIADIQYPDSIRIVGSYASGDMTGLDSQLGYVYLLGSILNSFQIIDAGNPLEPVLIGTTGNAFSDTCYSVTVAGGYAYIGTMAGMRIVDVRDPQLPELVSGYVVAEHTFGVAVDGDYVYAAMEFGGVHILNIAEPSAPEVAGIYRAPGWVTDVEVQSGFAYVLNNRNGLHVFDVNVPRYFSQIAWAPEYGGSNGISVANNRAYFVSSQPILPIVNVSDPHRPVIEGGANTPGNEWRVRTSGNYEYVASRERGMFVVDVSVSSTPSIIGFWDSPGTCWDLAVDGNYVYVADGGVGMDILDVSDPFSPRLVGHVWNNQWGWGPYRVQVQDGYAYLVGDISDLLVIDVHDPRNPFIVSHLTDEPGVSQGLFVRDQRAFILTNFGLRVYDLSDLSAPQLIDSHETPGRAWDYLSPRNVYVDGEYVYLADGFSFQILHYQPLAADEPTIEITEDFHMIGNFPNPFNPGTTIRYAIDKESVVELSIFDVTGIRVATLVKQRQQPGEYGAEWNAAEFPSGMYFATLRADERSETRKLVLMR